MLFKNIPCQFDLKRRSCYKDFKRRKFLSQSYKFKHAGGGLIINGQLYRGSSFSAGEIGHTTVVFGGEKCGCGNRGCLEKYASVPALLRSARVHLSKYKNSSLRRFIGKGKVTLKALTQAAQKDKNALQLLKQQAAYLASGLASAVNLVNFEKLVLGGGFLDVYPEFLKMVETELQQRVFPAALVKFEISQAKLGNQAGIVGAAFLGS